jgi:dihydrofolate reductase
MGVTSYFTATTLDGFIADEQDSLAWLFVQGQKDPSHRFGYETFISSVGAIVMGRTTYEWVVDHITTKGEEWMYSMPAWVMTHADLEPVPGADIRFSQGDVRAVHAEMAEVAGDQDIWIVGGGDLVGQFADAGLLDEIIAQVAPVTLGAGRPLLPRRLALRLEETEQNGDFVAARYSVVGPGAWED